MLLDIRISEQRQQVGHPFVLRNAKADHRNSIAFHVELRLRSWCPLTMRMYVCLGTIRRKMKADQHLAQWSTNPMHTLN